MVPRSILAIREDDKFEINLYSQFCRPVGQEIVKEMGGLIERDNERYVMFKGDVRREGSKEETHIES